VTRVSRRLCILSIRIERRLTLRDGSFAQMHKRGLAGVRVLPLFNQAESVFYGLALATRYFIFRSVQPARAGPARFLPDVFDATRILGWLS
jgi:hypothetical protein